MAKYASLSLLFLLCIPNVSALARPPPAFTKPASKAVDSVNPLIGNGGGDPNASGGMIPSTAPPFAMTRWVAQTRENFVSMTPYNYTDGTIHGFQGTHQPAIWMGESGQVVVAPGAGTVRAAFAERGLSFSHESEIVSPSYYRVELAHPQGGSILAEQSATSRVGHLRFTFDGTAAPYVLIEATRPTTIGSDDPARASIIYPEGALAIDPEAREITGRNPERQDAIIAPVSTPAAGFNGYFCARFDTPFAAWGTAQNGSVHEGAVAGAGSVLSGFARFAEGTRSVSVRVGVSFISVEQARRNLEREAPDGTSLEDTARATREEWAEKLDRIQVTGANATQREIFYTAFYHTLQYPYEQSEEGRYYSGYDDSVHEGESYTGYSIWDTYRAQWAWQILLAPERIPGMITSMLQDYKEGGWLPMWKNIIETNIMVGTHADSLIAEAVVKGITDFDLETAYEAVYKDATVPPINDSTTSYSDREENVDYEVRAGLSTVYAEKGWVAADIHSEAGSRTLDYAYDDYALAVLAAALNKSAATVAQFHERGAASPFTLYNAATGFMEARNADGSWAGETAGWTEGDKWAYSFDVVQDVPRLIAARGGNASFVASLDAHFDGGHNDHTNEPSHHIPYLYALAGAASKTQEHVRQIAEQNYFATVNGLTGNEDCGQMSAWYLFSALGFYPVDPISSEYVVGSPFFDRVTIDLPGEGAKPLVVSAPGAPTRPYVSALTVNGHAVNAPRIRHEDIARGGTVAFTMGGKPAAWGGAVRNSAGDHSEL